MRQFEGLLLPPVGQEARPCSRHNQSRGSLFTRVQSQIQGRASAGRLYRSPVLQSGLRRKTPQSRQPTPLGIHENVQLPDSPSRIRSANLPTRPKTEIPMRDIQSACSHRESQYTPSVEEVTARYEEVLKVHGWRAQVHGSTIKPITPRYTYSHYVEAPIQPPIEKREYHFRNDNTFFYKTIVHKPTSYVIHPNFFSERMYDP